MNKTTSKIIQISDIVEWSKKEELELSPKYQRGLVWNEGAKAYLMDTIIRGLPIPPIFLRQQVDIRTKSTRREIIDGQQRIRAILEFIVDEKYAIKRSHNKEYAGKRYSDLDEEMQEAILSYEILAEVVTEKDESLIYDMFARLNSNNYVLNHQEIRNAKYWGEFKVLVYRLAGQYRDFFLDKHILSDRDCTRMNDAVLITSMIILLLKGIVDETPNSVDKIYNEFNDEFVERDSIEAKFVSIMEIIERVYEYFIGNLSCLSNKNYFFTFYAVIVNQMFGIENNHILNSERNPDFSESLITNNIDTLYQMCGNFLNEYTENVVDSSSKQSTKSEWATFVENNSKRTTSKNARLSRISFMNGYFCRQSK